MAGPVGYGSTQLLPPAYEDYLHGTASHATSGKRQLVRRRWNSLGYLAALFLPWMVFAAMLAVVSFPVRNEYMVVSPALLCFLLCLLAFGFVLLFGFFSFVAWRRRVTHGLQEPTWYSFIFVTGLCGWFLGIVLGRMNWKTNLAPYYAIVDLNYYASVDPAVVHGRELMDAGRMTFTENSWINRSMSESYREKDVYCIAPVVSGTQAMARYDFWAVGRNCCSDHTPSFHCGQYADGRAKSGMRLNVDSARLYSLALQHAQAAFDIRSDYPIFLEWVEDVSQEVNDLHGKSLRYYLSWCFGFLACQFLVATACVFVLWYLGW